MEIAIFVQPVVSPVKAATVCRIAFAMSDTQVQMADPALPVCLALSKMLSDQLAHKFAAKGHIPMPQECHSASLVRPFLMRLLEVHTSQIADVCQDTQALTGGPVQLVEGEHTLPIPLGLPRVYFARQANIRTKWQALSVLIVPAEHRLSKVRRTSRVVIALQDMRGLAEPTVVRCAKSESTRASLAGLHAPHARLEHIATREATTCYRSANFARP
jgi:hypothetical protein